MFQRSWAWLGWAVLGMGCPCRAAQYQAGLSWFSISHSVGSGLCMVWLTACGCMWPGWAACSCGGSAPTHVAVHSLAVRGQVSAFPQQRQAGTPSVQNSTLGTAPFMCLRALTIGGHSQEMAVPGVVGAAWGLGSTGQLPPNCIFPEALPCRFHSSCSQSKFSLGWVINPLCPMPSPTPHLKPQLVLGSAMAQPSSSI